MPTVPTSSAGAPMRDATAVPWTPPSGAGSCALRVTMLERPANSGCATSTPESTIVIGLPGPGGVRPATPIAARHHSVATRGSVKSVTLMVPATLSGVVKRRALAGPEPRQHPRGRIALEPIEPKARCNGGGTGAAKDRGTVTRRGRPQLDELRRGGSRRSMDDRPRREQRQCRTPCAEHQVHRARSHTEERTCVLSEGFPTSLPSRMASRRGARAARSWSCVATITVAS